MVEEGIIMRDNLHIVLPDNDYYDLYFILGIINSKLMDFFYTFINPEKGEALAQVKKSHVEQLIIPKVSPENQKPLIGLVGQMLDLNKKLKEAKLPHAKELLKRQIETTDAQIDRLVYQLYGLTNEEIKIIESEAR